MSTGAIKVPIEVLGSLRISLVIKPKESVDVYYRVAGISYEFALMSTYGWYRKTFLPEMRNLIEKAREIEGLPLIDKSSSISMRVFAKYGGGASMAFDVYKSEHGTVISTRSWPRDGRYSGYSTSHSIDSFEKDLDDMIKKMREAITVYQHIFPDSFMKWNGKHL